jgi:hypothetical protein
MTARPLGADGDDVGQARDIFSSEHLVMGFFSGLGFQLSGNLD